MQLKDLLNTDLVKLRKAVDEVLEGTVYHTVEIQPYIEALPADDPRVIQDEVERAEAQAVIDATPQNVIDGATTKK